MQSIQNIFMKEQKQLLDRNNLAKALSRPDILRTINKAFLIRTLYLLNLEHSS